MAEVLDYTNEETLKLYEVRPKLPTEAELKNKKESKKWKKDDGRPTIMTEEVVTKLESAFSLGCDDKEACYYADISRNTFYVFLNKYPYFRDRFDSLRERTAFKARISVADGVEKDPKLALDYLRNKKNEEFGTRDKVDANISMEAKDKLRKMEAITNEIRNRSRSKGGN